MEENKEYTLIKEEINKLKLEILEKEDIINELLDILNKED